MIPRVGALGDHPFAAVLRDLVAAGETGQLRVQGADALRTVHLVAGRIVFATSTDPDDRLGESLLRRGLISWRDLEDSVRAVEAGKRQGVAFVEKGVLAPRDIVAAVAEQVQEIVIGLFEADGTYSFEAAPAPARELSVVQRKTADLVMEAARRIRGWSRLRAVLGDLSQLVRLRDDADQRVLEINLTREELGLLAVLDETMTVEDVCAASSVTDIVTCRFLFGLWAAGALDRVPQDRATVAVVEETEGQTAPHYATRGASVATEISRFNELHRYLYEVVQAELPEAWNGFFERAFAAAAREHPALFDGVAMDAVGELDGARLRRNIVEAEIARYVQGLARLLEIETQLARNLLGPDRVQRVTDGIAVMKEMQSDAL